MTADAAQVAAAYLAGVALLREAAQVLAESGIETMPLKGIWLQQCVYDRPEERPISDVDVLVAEASFERACAALARAEFVCRSRAHEEAAFAHRRYPLPLDLHRALFTRGAFALDARGVLERGRPDRTTFGVPLRMPDPLDVFAHLTGHFVKSGGTELDATHLRDFAAIVQRFSLDPATCAQHLQATGLGRAARYALAIAASVPEGEACARILRALDRDPAGELLATAAKATATRWPAHAGLRALRGFALDRSLFAGARALALRMHDRA